MSATALPLPLALSKPVPMASDLETVLAGSLGVGSATYNSETQMRTYDLNGTQLADGISITWNNSVSQINDTNGPVFQIDDFFQIDDQN
jgi:hypothetical protein